MRPVRMLVSLTREPRIRDYRKNWSSHLQQRTNSFFKPKKCFGTENEDCMRVQASATNWGTVRTNVGWVRCCKESLTVASQQLQSVESDLWILAWNRRSLHFSLRPNTSFESRHFLNWANSCCNLRICACLSVCPLPKETVALKWSNHCMSQSCWM